MKTEYSTIINNAIRRFQAKAGQTLIPISAVDSNDMYNHCVVIILELEPINTNQETFKAFAEKTLYYRLIDFVRDNITWQNHEIYDESGEDTLLEALYNVTLLNRINSLLKTKTSFHRDIVVDCILDKAISLKKVARIHDKHYSVVYTTAARLLNELKEEFYDELSESN